MTYVIFVTSVLQYRMVNVSPVDLRTLVYGDLDTFKLKEKEIHEKLGDINLWSPIHSLLDIIVSICHLFGVTDVQVPRRSKDATPLFERLNLKLAEKEVIGCQAILEAKLKEMRTTCTHFEHMCHVVNTMYDQLKDQKKATDDSMAGLMKCILPKLDSLTASSASTSNKVAELETALASMQPKIEEQGVDLLAAHNNIDHLEKVMNVMEMEVDELKKHKDSEVTMKLICGGIIKPFRRRIKFMETQLEALTSSTSSSVMFPSLQVQVAALQTSVQPLLYDAKMGRGKEKGGR